MLHPLRYRNSCRDQMDKHPLFDLNLVEEVIEYCNGEGLHSDFPVDCTDDWINTRFQCNKPVQVKTHLKQQGTTSYLILWSNGDRSWEVEPSRFSFRNGIRKRVYGQRRLKWCIQMYKRNRSAMSTSEIVE